jgi:hypothetical protein
MSVATFPGAPLAKRIAFFGFGINREGLYQMKARTFAIVASALALECAAFVTTGRAQGPMYDTVKVDLPYTVHIGDKTLEPGNYVIKELPSQDKSRVLVIYGNDGMTFEASAMTIPTYRVDTPDQTTVSLHHFTNDYYFDKVTIQGKNYGYEFPLPNSVKEREKERQEPISVAATYQAQPAPPQQAAAPPAEPQPEVAQAAPQPQAEVAQAQPEPEAQPEAPPQEAAPAPQPAPEANRELPTTSAGWLMILLSGGMLSGAGLLLRRRA